MTDREKAIVRFLRAWAAQWQKFADDAAQQGSTKPLLESAFYECRVRALRDAADAIEAQKYEPLPDALLPYDLGAV